MTLTSLEAEMWRTIWEPYHYVIPESIDKSINSMLTIGLARRVRDELLKKPFGEGTA